MLRKAPLALVLGAIPASAYANTLLYDAFDYGPVGTELSTADGAGGWLKVPATTNIEPTIGDGSIAYPGLPFTPAGNKVVGNSSAGGVMASSTRAIPGQPFLSVEEPTLYYSLLLNVTNVSGLASGNGSFIAGFRNNTSTSGLAGFEGGAPLLIRQTGTGTGLFQLGTGLTQEVADRTWDTANSYSAATGPLLLVFAYEFVAGGEDFARLWVNPDPNLDEAANAAALKVTASATDGHGIRDGLITNFFFRNNGVAPDGWEADELRIASSWEGLWSTVAQGIWLGGADNWSESAKWTAGVVPNVASLPVQIDAGNAAASVVTLDQDASVRTVTLNADDTLNIDAGRTLTLSAPGSNFSGIVNHSGALVAPAITVSGAAAEFRYLAGSMNVAGVQLSSGGKLLMSAGGGKTLRVEGLSVNTASGSQLDVADNKVVVANGNVGTSDGATYSGLSGLIQSGRSGGTRNGAGIRTSMPDAVTGLTALGIATANQVGYTGLTFGGVTVAAADALIMYTYAGDANLDGFISGDDYSAIDFASGTPGASGWVNGDFNWDGIISGDDYSAIDFNIVAQGAPFPVNAAVAGGIAAVPEPSTATVLGAAAVAMVRRRRRTRV